ncbi:unnamed protein product [Chrysoparadoxa australica]
MLQSLSGFLAGEVEGLEPLLSEVASGYSESQGQPPHSEGFATRREEDLSNATPEEEAKLEAWLWQTDKHGGATAAKVIRAVEVGPVWLRGFVLCSPQFGTPAVAVSATLATALRCMMFGIDGPFELLVSALILVFEFRAFAILSVRYAERNDAWNSGMYLSYLVLLGVTYSWMGSERIPHLRPFTLDTCVLGSMISWPCIMYSLGTELGSGDVEQSRRPHLATKLLQGFDNLKGASVAEESSMVMELLKYEGRQREKVLRIHVSNPFYGRDWHRGCDVGVIMSIRGHTFHSIERDAITTAGVGEVGRSRTAYATFDRRVVRKLHVTVSESSINRRHVPVVVEVEDAQRFEAPVVRDEVLRWADNATALRYIRHSQSSTVYDTDCFIVIMWLVWSAVTGVFSNSFSPVVAVALTAAAYPLLELQAAYGTLPTSLEGVKRLMKQHTVVALFVTLLSLVTGILLGVAPELSLAVSMVTWLAGGTIACSAGRLWGQVAQGVRLNYGIRGTCHYAMKERTVGCYRLCGVSGRPLQSKLDFRAWTKGKDTLVAVGGCSLYGS